MKNKFLEKLKIWMDFDNNNFEIIEKLSIIIIDNLTILFFTLQNCMGFNAATS